jgi:hypothetical protein
MFVRLAIAKKRYLISLALAELRFGVIVITAAFVVNNVVGMAEMRGGVVRFIPAHRNRLAWRRRRRFSNHCIVLAAMGCVIAHCPVATKLSCVIAYRIITAKLKNRVG